MTKADSVHSTPRETASKIIDFKTWKSTLRTKKRGKPESGKAVPMLDCEFYEAVNARIAADDSGSESCKRKPLAEPQTETCRNQRLRIARRDGWWHAGRVADYWRARLDWLGALETAQRWEIADSASLQLPGNVSRYSLVDTWREAVVKQLLTPAPDGGAVAWKRAKLQGREFAHLPIKAPRVEQSIAADVEFLTAHPARRPSKGGAK
jgi:hypothetical protein